MDSSEHFDVVVVGAGLQGLCAAHTFLSLDPSLSLLLVDSNKTVGGTWCQERIYPGLRANNLQGYFEFTDFSILDADVGVKERGLLSGEAIYAYFHKYAKEFDLLRRTRFSTKVVSATDNQTDAKKAWTLELLDLGSSKSASISCSKLLVATGQTSRPLLPSYPSANLFKKPFIHTLSFAKEGMSWLEDSSVSHVTVIGGGKSAHDAVYALATSGKRVTWIIRKSSRGGTWMAGSFPQLGPAKVWLEGLLMTRPLSWMGAAPWAEGDGFSGSRWFLHNTKAGRFIMRSFYAQMSGDTIAQNGMLSLGKEKTEILKPDATLQWYGGQAAILHYDKDFYGVLQDTGVEIVHEDISDLSSDGIILSTGGHIQTDAIICATGYKLGPAFPILPESSQLELGMPVTPEKDTIYPALDDKADLQLFKSFPELLESPKAPEKFQDMTPWRLWRFIAPPSQAASGPRTLAFLNTQETYENCLKSELVALWSYAYLNNELSVQPGSKGEVQYEAALWSRFGWWSRPLGKQGKTADMLFDAMPYYDRLMSDLGLWSWRKGWGVLGELFGGWYELKEYKGIKEEWLASRNRL